MRADRSIRSGDVVARRFQIEREAGRGGMGTVYRATDLERGGPVALKLLRPDAGPETDRFRRESEVLASLGHPAIVRHVAHGIDGVTPWLAMEWLDGESLSEALRRAPLAEQDAVALVRTAADALGAAHLRGIVHRDVKPGNLFLVGRSPKDVRVLDFGIARTLAADARTLTTTGTVLGTAAYMAPEQARAGRDLDARTDVWALGCVLYEAISGQKPFDHESLVGVLASVLLEEPRPLLEVAPHVSAACSALVRELLEKDREKRPSSGSELARRLDALKESASLSAASTIPRGITSRERRVVCVVLGRPSAHETSDATGPGAGWQLDVSASAKDDEGTLRAVADAHGGKVELLADGTLVVALDDTGTPTDQAERAARLALAMQSAAPDANLALCAGRAELHGRVPVGEVVDRGARLLDGPREAGTVAVDDVVSSLLDTRFELVPSDRGTRLRAVREGPDAARTILGRALPFVGRDRELATLLGLADESQGDRVARVALVSGPPGSGKTRLLAELAQRVAEAATPTRVLTVRGEPLALGAPFSIAARLLRLAAGIIDGEPLEERRLKLARLAEAAGLGARAPHVAALLGEIARAPFDDADDEVLRAARRDSLALGDLIRRAFSDWLGAEAARAPVALFLDDLHAIDAATLGLVDAALRAGAGLPLLCVGLFRPTPDAAGGPAPFAEREPQQLSLQKLAPRHCRALAQAALGPGATDERADVLATRCEGNPFFLEEMARALTRGGDDVAPVSVLGIVEDRLAELSPRARRILRAASVLGARARRADLLALVPDAPPAEVDADLAALEEEELLCREGEDFGQEKRWSFRQPLVREAAYAMLTDDDRRLAHRLASELVERDPEHDPALLAEHLDRAGLGAAAAVAFARAADRALRGHDLRGAVALAERGLRLGSSEARGALLGVHARALRWQGSYERAFDSAREALATLATGEPAWLDAASTLLSAATALGRSHECRALRTTLLGFDAAPESAGAVVVVLARAASLTLASGQDEERRALGERARWLAQRRGGPDPLSDAWLAVLDASTALRDGDVGAFALGTEVAAAAYERAGDVRDAVNQRVRLGNAWVSLGAPERAEPVLRAAAREAERMGLRLVEGYAWQNLGHALLRLERTSDARLAIDRALALAQALRDRRLEAGSRLYLAEVARAEGRADLTLREAERALALSEGAGDLRLVAQATLARAALEAGDRTRAARVADEALDALGRAEIALEEGDALVCDALASVLSACGRRDEARTLARSALDRLARRAAKIADPELRASLLERVPEHARLRTLAGGL